MDRYCIIHHDDTLTDIAERRGQVQVWLNNGDLTFTNKVIGLTGSWMGIVISDYDYDGNLDMWASNFGGYSDRVISPGAQFLFLPFLLFLFFVFFFFFFYCCSCCLPL